MRPRRTPSQHIGRLAARLLLAAVAIPASLAVAEPARCPVPADLAARDGEKAPQKGNRRFDRSEPARALTPFAAVAPGLRGAIRRVELPKGSRKLIALTLDLCEQTGEIAGYDGAIFDTLRRERVRATLFAGGKWMRSHEPRMRQLMLDPLFEIGNHGWAHRNLRLLDGAILRDEITGPQRAYEAIRAGLDADRCLDPAARQRLPQRIGLFRFPFGACHKASLDAVNDAGLVAIQWDLSTGDPSPTQSAAAIAAAMVRNARPGSIIIAHANGRGFNTAAALPIAIPKLKAMGFEFVTVSELIAAGKPVVTPTCYDSRPGDTDRYDTLFAPRSRPAPPAPAPRP
jgi:peptidoglycan/xylan/chitin deacetylase (PgdA/CDA1 family)